MAGYSCCLVFKQSNRLMCGQTISNLDLSVYSSGLLTFYIGRFSDDTTSLPAVTQSMMGLCFMSATRSFNLLTAHTNITVALVMTYNLCQERQLN